MSNFVTQQRGLLEVLFAAEIEVNKLFNCVAKTERGDGVRSHQPLSCPFHDLLQSFQAAVGSVR